MMNRRKTAIDDDAMIVNDLTRSWGSRDAVSLYLDRCQVATPDRLVASLWTHVGNRRSRIGTVVDFGAGDARLARGGKFRRYVGYEIDPRRSRGTVTAKNVSLLHRCAFSDHLDDADLCVGNPPYVRNQDLPDGWRQRAAEVVLKRTGVSLSGLANAWQYFFLLSLASVKKDGLIALIVPYEWVSRPSAAALRAYIEKEKWAVDVFRLRDDSFDRVLTTSSITIIDKSVSSACWSFYEENEADVFRKLPSASGGIAGVLAYARRSKSAEQTLRAKRGLSPGTQDVLTLTEGERVRAGLHVGSDVVRCVTSLRNISHNITTLDKIAFDVCLRNIGAKCWLIRTDREPSERLAAYLNSINKEKYQTATCLSRDRWWKFTMPEVPELLIASGFRGEHPKIVANSAGARAVGGVCGIYGATNFRHVVTAIKGMDFSTAVVAHSNGLKKLEINQLNSVLAELDHE